MKRVMITLFAASLVLVAVFAFADKELPVFKKGDSVYVCTCGDGCDCKTMSRNKGKCSCGKALGKGEVTSVEGDKSVVKVDGKEFNLNNKAKYACGCGEACTCGTISQKPGKCSCGSEMKKVN
ncbi:MAG TPA: hypothetical protein HPP76_12215 [Desulfuromonadales bacterium]|nr:hypothetical protein [Desulfuromonadales bacterium]